MIGVWVCVILNGLAKSNGFSLFFKKVNPF